MKECTLCPRKCKAQRSIAPGFCNAKDKMIISKVMLHQYEEPILTATNDKGSGAIFFSGCNLRCVYCQNYQISHVIKGKEISPQELAQIIKDLENQGAGNIDLVTPTHFTDQIIEALKIYKPKVPVIWNTSGYEEVSTIKKLKNYVDIYLADFKYGDNSLSLKYSSASDYKDKALQAIKQMRINQPHDIYKGNKLVKGIIIRHMVLPKNAKDSLKVLNLIAKTLSNQTILSILSQYTPMGECQKFEELTQKVSALEYKIVVNHAIKLGFKNAFIQDLDSASSYFTPDF